MEILCNTQDLRENCGIKEMPSVIEIGLQALSAVNPVSPTINDQKSNLSEWMEHNSSRLSWEYSSRYDCLDEKFIDL